MVTKVELEKETVKAALGAVDDDEEVEEVGVTEDDEKEHGGEFLGADVDDDEEVEEVGEDDEKEHGGKLEGRLSTILGCFWIPSLVKSTNVI